MLAAYQRLTAVWNNATPLPAQDIALQVVDLPGQYLGLTQGRIILLDRDAAGFGWFIDSTPDDDREFATGNERPEGIDLLTVLTHELGHTLGLSDLYGADHRFDLIHNLLDAGQRRMSTAAHDAVFAENEG